MNNKLPINNMYMNYIPNQNYYAYMNPMNQISTMIPTNIQSQMNCMGVDNMLNTIQMPMTESIQEENYSQTLSQSIINNVENKFAKFSENCNNLILKKLDETTEKNNFKILNGNSRDLKIKNENMKENFKLIDKFLLDMIEQISSLVDNTNEIKIRILENIDVIKNSVNKEEQNSSDLKLKECLNECDLLTAKVAHNIQINKNELFNNLVFQEHVEMFQEIKNFINNKFTEITHEVNRISQQVLEEINYGENNNKLLSNSVKKLTEIKSFIERTKLNNKIKGITHNNFLLPKKNYFKKEKFPIYNKKRINLGFYEI